MNPIDKLKKVLVFAEDKCSTITKKYDVCNAHINACFTAGQREINTIQGVGTVFTPLDWTFDKCMKDKGCEESKKHKIPTGATTVSPPTGDGGFRPAGRGNGAKPPTPLNPNQHTFDRLEKAKQLCELKKQKLERIYSLAVAKQEELFNAGCSPYLRTSTNTANNEAARATKLKVAINKLKITATKDLATLNASSVCSGK